MKRGNRVAGESVCSALGGRFEVRAACAPYGPIASWPTSGAADVERALEALVEPAPGSGGRELLRGSRRALAEDGRARAELRARVGLEESEEPHIPRGPWGMAGFAEIPPRRGVAVVRAHWSELFEAPLADAFVELEAGRAVLLLSDPRAPMVADAVADALLGAGVPPRALGVLHGLTDEGLRALLAAPRVVALRASGGPRLVVRLRRLAHARGPREQHLRLIRAGAALVEEGQDPRAAAADVVRRAFSRTRALSGQAPGSLARVHVAAPLFSAFTGALLAEVARDASVQHPLPLIDRDAAQRVRAVWRRGLDQGATLVFGGPEPEERRAERGIRPAVFTNVELGQRLARTRRPLPILSLLRLPHPTGALRGPGGGLGA